MDGNVVVLSQDTLVLPGDVIGDKVDDGFETGLVRAVQQGLELFHPAGFLVCQIRVYVKVIRYGIGTSGIPFHHLFACRCGMAYYACVPDITGTEPLDVFKGPGVDG